MAERIYNVKRVAEIIAASDDEKVIEQTIRKIRHWTNSDILSTVGDKNTGTGVSRMYDDTGVRIAALLAEITKYGVTVDMVDTFEEWIMESWVGTAAWKEAITGDEDIAFQIGWHQSGAGFSRPVPKDGKLFWKPHGGRKEEAYTSSIVVNMTNVFRRLAW